MRWADEIHHEPLHAAVQQYARALAEGPRGFQLDTAKLRFPHDAATLARLQAGIECGAITGIVIEDIRTPSS